VAAEALMVALPALESGGAHWLTPASSGGSADFGVL